MAKVFHIGMVLSLGLALGLGGCALDRTSADYQAEKVKNEQAKYKDAAGVYRGTLYSSATSEEMGAVEVTLDVKSLVGSSPGASGAVESYAGLRGSIVLYQGEEISLTKAFEDGAYAPSTGAFNLKTTIGRSNGKSVTVNVTGVVTTKPTSNMSITILANDFSNFKGVTLSNQGSRI